MQRHRPVAGPIKTIASTREADGWHVVFSCALAAAQVPPSTLPATGIDLGRNAFLVAADGREVAPPRYSRQAQQAPRRARRAVARKQKGSHRRKKAGQRLARQHLHVANQRRTLQHQVVRQLIGRYGVIAHEALNLQGIARSQLAKSTYDVGWGRFRTILRRKAEGAGVQVLAVPAANTTQQWSVCGKMPPRRSSASGWVIGCIAVPPVATQLTVISTLRRTSYGSDGAFRRQRGRLGRALPAKPPSLDSEGVTVSPPPVPSGGCARSTRE
jgi:putative transposase